MTHLSHLFIYFYFLLLLSIAFIFFRYSLFFIYFVHYLVIYSFIYYYYFMIFWFIYYFIYLFFIHLSDLIIWSFIGKSTIEKFLENVGLFRWFLEEVRLFRWYAWIDFWKFKKGLFWRMRRKSLERRGVLSWTAPMDIKLQPGGFRRHSEIVF